MPGLTGVTRVSGFVIQSPQATPEQRSGDPADPRHGRGLVGERMPWQLEAWALTPVTQTVQDGLPDNPAGLALPAGMIQPGTPLVDWAPQHSHAAPWPKGVETSVDPDAVSRRLIQSAEIHASGTGASSPKTQVIPAQQDDWREAWNPGAETPTLQDPVNRQVRIAAGGYGSTDRAGNPRGVNGNDMQNAHLHRRYAAGRIPGNYQWMLGKGRPLVKSIPGTARPPVGPGSPFEGQDPARAFGVQGAVLTRPAGDYVAPPAPYTAPASQAGAEPGPVVFW